MSTILELEIENVPYNEELGETTLMSNDWSNKVTDGIGEGRGDDNVKSN